jgi:predicted TIM-barrel fold metal-dependent hydrolase
MINGKIVVDAVTHAFDARPELADLAPEYRYGMMIHEGTFRFQEAAFDPPYRLSREEFFQRMPPEALASALFFESATDLAWFHSIPAWGIWPDLSPATTGLAVKERFPGRMFMYGAVSPLEGAKAIEDLERQAEEWHITGVKLYPADFVDGKLRPWYMSEQDVLYPILERCRDLGIKVVAVHKAVPLGNAPTAVFRPDDVDYPAQDFPDLNFEIVHGGFAFLEETALQIARFENVYVNLEATTGLLLKSPARFARIIGELLFWGGASRIVWGTGATVVHPAPLIEAFDKFTLPATLVRDEGYPQLDDDIRADIFSRNFARLHNLAIDDLMSAVAADEVSKALKAGKAAPWSALRESGAQRNPA